MRVLVFDIDGTICTNTSGDYEKAKPFKLRIDYINKLYDSGNTIIFYTARGMGTSGNSLSLASKKWQEFTESQLLEWGVKYHKIFLGKPSGDIYVDDKGQKDSEFFEHLGIENSRTSFKPTKG
jgi:hypothetical protein